MDVAEDGLDGTGALDVLEVRAVFVVEKVDVDAVFVVGGADRSDGGEGELGLGPVADHTEGVVDEEDGVECREEGVLVVCCGVRSGDGGGCWDGGSCCR